MIDCKMTILIYDYHELEERASSHLRVWKAWHTIIYILAAIGGIFNFTCLQSTMQLVDNNCVLYPRKLEFHWVRKPDLFDTRTDDIDVHIDIPKTPIEETRNLTKDNVTENAQATTIAVPKIESAEQRTKRDVSPGTKLESVVNETTMENSYATVITENATSRLVLDTFRTLFLKDSECQFPEYMPILSTVFAVLWAVLFIICPGGGRTTTTTSLQEPWRILTPALIFALILVGLMGHNFTKTNSGLLAFCESFHNLTNATTCSSVDPFLERAWDASWGFGVRAAATRAAAAGAWVSWACAAALLLARCLAAPDFQVRRTGVYLKDPHQKLIPHLLKKSPRRSQRSTHSSPSKRDTVSVRSEPTTVTELVSASVEHPPHSDPTSLTASPVSPVRHEMGEAIEMTYSPHELNQH